MAPTNVPNIYSTIPDQTSVPKKDGQLSQQQLKQFFEDGFLIIEDYFDKTAELDPCLRDIEVLVEDLAQSLFKAGKIKNLYKDAGIYQRLSLIEKEFKGSLVILHKTGILPKSFRQLWANERLLAIMEQLIGPNVGGNPIWNLRPKVPQEEAGVVPWHQDNAYCDESANDVLCITAWIPFLDANEANGTLQAVRGAHRPGKLAAHHGCWRDTWYVSLEPEEIERTLGIKVNESSVVTCNVPYGGMVLFTNMTPHRSLDNVSDKIRWSVDLRWQDPNKSWGLFNVKEGIVFRTTENPNATPDWNAFTAVNRNKAQIDFLLPSEKEAARAKTENMLDEHDTTNVGPWMSRWPIDHENRHTERFKQLASQTGTGTSSYGAQMQMP